MWHPALLAATVLCVIPPAATAAPGKQELFVESIKSVAQVKEKLHALAKENRDCVSGSCWIETGYEICYYIGGLDAKLDYKISAASKDRKPKPQLEISDADLRQFQLMFGQCKLRNFPTLLQVVYSPSKRTEKLLNAWLSGSKK